MTNNVRKALRASLFFFLMLLVAACGGKRVNGILTEREMVDVLHDYQLAMAYARQQNGSSKEQSELEYKYSQAVFVKYHVTEDEFNLSMAHYARDPKTMLAITKKVSERLAKKVNEQSDAIDAKRNQEAAERAARIDTVEIWQRPEGVLLAANGDNFCEFDIPADGVLPNSQLLLKFNKMWVYREGSKNAQIFFTITYSGDSVSVLTDNIREYANDRGYVFLNNSKRKVKSLKLQIYQNAMWQTYPQLLSLTDFVLYNVVSKEQEEK